MLNLLGLKNEDLAALPGRFQEAITGLRDDLACLKDAVAAIQRTLEYEYGRPRRDLHGHDPAQMPLIAQVQVLGEVRRIDVAGLLGKPATRGHVVNIGDVKARLWFQMGPQRVGPYFLLPASALDLSFAVESIEVSDAGEGQATVQMLFQ